MGIGDFFKDVGKALGGVAQFANAMMTAKAEQDAGLPPGTLTQHRNLEDEVLDAAEAIITGTLCAGQRVPGTSVLSGGLSVPTWPVVHAYVDAKSGKPRRLSAELLCAYEEVFPDVDLASVRYHHGAGDAIYGKRPAVTFGHHIYLRGKFDPDDADDIELMTHELVHVRQYEDRGFHGFAYAYGPTLCTKWERRPLEREAIREEKRLRPLVREALRVGCASSAQPEEVQIDDVWTAWGSTLVPEG